MKLQFNSIRKRCSKILKDPAPGKLLAGEHWTKIKLSEQPSVILLSSLTPGKVNSRSIGKQGPWLAFTHGPRFYTDGLASLDLNPLLCRTASDLLSFFFFPFQRPVTGWVEWCLASLKKVSELPSPGAVPSTRGLSLWSRGNSRKIISRGWLWSRDPFGCPHWVENSSTCLASCYLWSYRRPESFGRFCISGNETVNKTHHPASLWVFFEAASVQGIRSCSAHSYSQRVQHAGPRRGEGWEPLRVSPAPGAVSTHPPLSPTSPRNRRTSKAIVHVQWEMKCPGPSITTSLE